MREGRAQSNERWLGSDFDRRQTNGTQPTGTPDAQQQRDPDSAPLSTFTFIIAVALFVLIIGFVTIRLYVRGRRLRRLGLYQEGPFERFIGSTREYEDTLPLPTLWEAKVADVPANGGGMLGGAGPGSSDGAQKRGWESLVPLSAALPPSLYEVLYTKQDNATADGRANLLSSHPAQPQLFSSSGLFGRHMPALLRRNTGDAGQTLRTDECDTHAKADSRNNDATTSFGQTEAVQMETDSSDERLSASVNVTVLIAMPSPKTVYPAGRKNARLDAGKTIGKRSTSRDYSEPYELSQLATLENGDETTVEADAGNPASKGKSRRTPSIRSVRTLASTKSQGEARREAFLRAEAAQEPLDLPPSSRLSMDGDFAGHDGIKCSKSNDGHENEDMELPELVFGTASIPLYARITPILEAPTRAEILALASCAASTKTRKRARPEVGGGQVKGAETASNDVDEPQSPSHQVSSANAGVGRLSSASRYSETYEMSTVGADSGDGGGPSCGLVEPSRCSVATSHHQPFGRL